MTTDPTRRRVLQLTGAGATASLAGCTGLLSEDNELEADEEPDIDPEDGITAAVQPVEEDLMELEQDIMADIEAGDISQEEAQAEVMERQNELFMSRSIEFESTIADIDDLTVEAAIGEAGAFLLSGSDERMVELLRDGDVNALLPGEEYADALEAEAETPPEAEPEPEPDEDADDEPDEDADDEPDEDADDDDDGGDEDDSGDEGDD